MTPIERVAALADEKPAPAQAVKSSSTGFDLPGFIARHGLRIRKEKSADEFMLYELEVCPFNADHKGGSAYITQSADGKLGFHCHHSSCADKDWRKLRDFLEPDYQKRASQRASNGTTQSAPSDEALDILRQPAPPEVNSYPADATQMVADIERFIRRFVVLPDAAYLPSAIWVIGTYSVQHFDCFPYIALLSPAKRCGKTRLLEVLETFVYRPWRGTAPTPAALYRMMTEGPTLLLDEVEALNSKNRSESSQAILAILNAGHRKGATIPRCDGPNHELKLFAVYGPKAFAAIGRLPDTLTDRSIVVTMQRRTRTQKVERFLAARATAEAKPIRNGVASFAKAYQSAIGQAYGRLLGIDLEFLSDRDADLWIPLFAVCAVSAPDRVEELKGCAVTLSGAKAGDDANDSRPLRLLADIKAAWPDGNEHLDSKTLVEKLIGLEESLWAEYGLSQGKLAKLLRPFGVESRGIRIGEKTPKGYHYDSLKSAFERYLEA
jgi:Protein of unknown function (DUF3631)